MKPAVLSLSLFSKVPVLSSLFWGFSGEGKAQEAYLDGLHFPAAIVLSVLLSHAAYDVLLGGQGLGHLAGFFSGGADTSPSVQGSGAGCLVLSGWDSSMTVHLERSQPLFAYSSRSQPALGQKPALIPVQAWEVMALINSCITIWISFHLVKSVIISKLS